jgi:phospholipid/cholesterol/gamma-HCH transport system substrate-binding protein
VVIAIGIGLVCFGIFSIGGGSRFLTRSETIVARFHRINGLQDGAPVTLSGVKVGAVDSIKFPTDPLDTHVIVTMWIAESAAERIRTDSVAQISSMGLLGDKFVELSPGTIGAPVAEAGSIIPSRDPIDYEALLQKPGTDDLIANILAISNSMRALLDQIEKGHGLLAEVMRGEQGVPPERQLNLASIQQTLTSVNRLSIQMDTLLTRINRGEGLAGQMLSGRGKGGKFLSELEKTAISVQQTSARLDRMMERFDKAQGLFPQLMNDKESGTEVLANLRQSSHDLKDILHKIDAGQGTIGMAVNDPQLYFELRGLLADGGGWAIGLVRGLYNLTHPFAPPAAETVQPVIMPQSEVAAPSAAPVTASAPAGPNNEAPAGGGAQAATAR